MKILVTGASGYIGGRLVPRLLAAGHQVRCMTRDPAKLLLQPWRDDVEVVKADALSSDQLGQALAGCDAAFYLVHSMESGTHDFEARDREAAETFRDAAQEAGVGRIVYLGGLGANDDLSKHLSSRHEVGAVLASGATPVTELRAAVIIGSGSVSFEMLRYLTEVLPIMVTPRWVRTKCQPIAVGDVLEILAASLDDDSEENRIHEIGGPEVLTYEEMMRVYAEEAGLPRRLIVPVPVLSPKLSSHWVGLVTPLPTAVAKPLVESLRIEVTVSDNRYSQQVVGELTPYRESVARALRTSHDLEVATRWSDAAPGPAQPLPSDPAWSGGTLLTDRQEVSTDAAAEDVFWAFSRIGGEVGYYAHDWAWSVRGLLDSLVGGVGLRRGRRHPENLRVGEALDFWRVESIVPGRSLTLFAEMKLPGDAWLAFEAVPRGDGSLLRQTAVFNPRGLLGRLYWWVLFPFHLAIFGRMARRIVEAATSRPSPNGGVDRPADPQSALS